SIPKPDLMSPKVVGTIVHHILMSYAEDEFNKSEVFLHLGNNDKAEAAYKKGVIAGMTHWQWAEDEDFQTPGDSFFDNAKVKFNNSLERIIEQKYLALYMNDYQQWFEYRRTGYPVLPKTDEMLHNGVMPQDCLIMISFRCLTRNIIKKRFQNWMKEILPNRKYGGKNKYMSYYPMNEHS